MSIHQPLGVKRAVLAVSPAGTRRWNGRLYCVVRLRLACGHVVVRKRQAQGHRTALCTPCRHAQMTGAA